MKRSVLKHIEYNNTKRTDSLDLHMIYSTECRQRKQRQQYDCPQSDDA